MRAYLGRVGALAIHSVETAQRGPPPRSMRCPRIGSTLASPSQVGVVFHQACLACPSVRWLMTQPLSSGFSWGWPAPLWVLGPIGFVSPRGAPQLVLGDVAAILGAQVTRLRGKVPSKQNPPGAFRSGVTWRSTSQPTTRLDLQAGDTNWMILAPGVSTKSSYRETSHYIMISRLDSPNEGSRWAFSPWLLFGCFSFWNPIDRKRSDHVRSIWK